MRWLWRLSVVEADGEMDVEVEVVCCWGQIQYLSRWRLIYESLLNKSGGAVS